MNCKACENLMELYVHEDLSKPEREMFEKHLGRCKNCSEELNKTKQLISKIKTLTGQISMPDWNRSWDIINRNIQTGLKRGRIFLNFFHSKWRYAIAGSVFLFLLGFFIGKYLFISSPGKEPSDQKLSSNFKAAICEYLEDIKPFILDYSNYQPVIKNEEDISFDRVIANKLLIKNRLLQHHTLQVKNRKLQQLLEELEIILMEISDIGSSESDNLLLIKELIKIKKTIYKLENLYLEQILKNGFSGGKI